MSAPAAARGVRVLEREARTLHRRHVVDRDVVQVLRREWVDEQLEPLGLDDEIVFRRLVSISNPYLKPLQPPGCTLTRRPPTSGDTPSASMKPSLR
jgi:hypothetical protein